MQWFEQLLLFVIKFNGLYTLYVIVAYKSNLKMFSIIWHLLILKMVSKHTDISEKVA
jgi:hypothetical protein